MSLERAEPFVTHMSAYKLQKSLEMDNFRTCSQGGSGGMPVGGGAGGYLMACLSGGRCERERVLTVV